MSKNDIHTSLGVSTVSYMDSLSFLASKIARVKLMLPLMNNRFLDWHYAWRLLCATFVVCHVVWWHATEPLGRIKSGDTWLDWTIPPNSSAHQRRPMLVDPFGRQWTLAVGFDWAFPGLGQTVRRPILCVFFFFFYYKKSERYVTTLKWVLRKNFLPSIFYYLHANQMLRTKNVIFSFLVFFYYFHSNRPDHERIIGNNWKWLCVCLIEKRITKVERKGYYTAHKCIWSCLFFVLAKKKDKVMKLVVI